MWNDQLDHLIRRLDFHHDFQPVVDLKNQEILGWEALIRSKHFGNPEKLFNYAKSTGKLFSLDLASIVKALSTYNDLWTKGMRQLYLINVYPSTLTDPSFVYFLENLKSVINLPYEQIVFEVNESEIISDLKTLSSSLRHLKELGFLIALDDLGKGSAKINTMLKVNPDLIKVDRHLTKNISTSIEKQNFIKLILQLSGPKKQVIVEGIENKEELETIKALGVPYGQGFYLGLPTSIQKIVKKRVKPSLRNL